jgi:hypothetical protein
VPTRRRPGTGRGPGESAPSARCGHGGGRGPGPPTEAAARSGAWSPAAPCLNFVVTFFLTWFPSYLVTERRFDLLKLGFFGVIPGLTAIAGSWAGGMAGDALLARGWSASPIVIGALAGATGSFVVPLVVTGGIAVLGAASFGLLIRRVEPLPN